MTHGARRGGAVVVGSVNADLVVHTERAPERGETLGGVDFHVYPGGKGANQAVALGRLGAAVAMVGLTGEDSFAAMLRSELRAAQVDCSALGVTDSATGVALITTEQGGANRIVVVPGANGNVTPEYVEQHRALIEKAAVLLLQLELPLPAVTRAAEIAHAAGVITMLDPAPAQPLPPKLLQLIDWLTPNQTEAGVLLGRPLTNECDDAEARRAAEALLATGVRNVLVKLGAAGCVLALRDGTHLQSPAFLLNAVDTTAAGDAFNAGFAAALLRELPMEAALREASAVAALSVTRAGAIPSLPTRSEVETFLQSVR